MSRSISFRWEPGFVQRIDAARGDVPRSVWVRRAVERALDAEESSARFLEQMRAREKPNSLAEQGAALKKVFGEPMPDEPPLLRGLSRAEQPRRHAASCKCPVCS